MQQDEAKNLELLQLIDAASIRAGNGRPNDSALGRALDMPFQKISDIRHGRKAASPEDCALFAYAAGLDPITEMARAAVRKHEGTKKGDLLMRALGKASLATGVAVASAGAHASLISGVVRTLVDTMYIVIFAQRKLRLL
jgi:hypothetical protein